MEYSVTTIMAMVITLLILAMLFTLILLFRTVKAVRELRIDINLDREIHEQWVNEILLMSSRLRTLGEESAAWATLVEEKFRNQDDVETARRIKKGLPAWVRFDIMKADKLGIDPAEPGTDG